MTRFQRIGMVGLCLAMAVGMVVPPMLRAAAPAKPAAANAGRTQEKILEDLSAAQEETTKVMPSLSALADPEFRASDGKKALPAIKKMVALMTELEASAKDNESMRDDVRANRYLFMAFVAALGDKETQTALETKAAGKDAEALSAKSALALDNWLLASKDAAAQEKVVKDFAVVAKENPNSDEVAMMLGAMSNLGPANNDITKEITDVIRANLKGDRAKSMLAQMDAQQEMLAMVGKPLVIAGRTSTGSKFTSADYKGKVVMVDFWATWCGPCIGELPNVKKAYADYHPKGLEIVGVSCDGNDEVLNSFTQKNDMTWVQLREDSQTDADHWHPIAKKMHVDGIPAMFLIDKKGLLRYVDAREDLAKKIALLVAEGDGAATPPAAK